MATKRSRYWELRCKEEQVWMPTPAGMSTNPNLRHLLDFTVMTYNILSPDLASHHPYLYTKCAPGALDWERRSHAVANKIRFCSPDIVCLQEVYQDYFYSTLRPQFGRQGYRCLYKKKTGDKKDGCAILIHTSKFLVERVLNVEFNWNKDTLLCRDNIGMVVLLKPRQAKSPSRLCVATTHLLFTPKHGDIRLAQLMVLLAEIDKVAKRRDSRLSGHYHPVVLCGDFNSTPFSPLYNFVSQGSLSLSNLAASQVSSVPTEAKTKNKLLDIDDYINDDIGISPNCKYVNYSLKFKKVHDDCLRHDFSFHSTYRHFNDAGDHEVTTRHNLAQETVDYIFYSIPTAHQDNSPLVHLASFSLPTSKQILANRLPSFFQPSDHFPLLAHFGWNLFC